MLSNPFSSSTYVNIWLKHYGNNQKAHEFKFLDGVKFIKGNYSGQYVNIGGNYTNGLFYEINEEETDFKGKSFLLYDVPQYLQSDINFNGDLKVIKLKQYKGFYINVEQYESIDDVVLKCYSSRKSRYNFRRSLKQLEEKHNISSKMFFGDIDRNDYDTLLKDFRQMMEIRFEGINTENTLLPMWDFYEEVLFPMINESKVALFVIYDSEVPIAISINFAFEDTFVVAMRTFDIEYSRLGIGNIEIYKLVEWCLENNVKTLDFSKGESDYKKRWCDTDYVFERHIIYDSNSLKAKTIAKTVSGLHNFKQYLRDKKVNLLFHHLMGIFSSKK
ncbi:GNAT family N-acetyltransferase [Winogradskyella sp. R77965]|uniref:GNAT family N-acetyltransferase n=1 Tax=Winogradskyella sp. R77965 TaxID=3093872 RepID=UPI0037DC4691